MGEVKDRLTRETAYGVTFPFIALMSAVTAWYMERQDTRGAFSPDGSRLLQGMPGDNTTSL